MDILPFIDRLKNRVVGDIIASVGEIDTMKDALDATKGRHVCAFVMFSSENGGAPKGMTGVTSQRVAYRFMVILGVLNAGPGALAKGSVLEKARDLVKDELVGWQPEGADSPITFVRAANSLKDAGAGLLQMGLEFSTDYQLRKDEHRG